LREGTRGESVRDLQQRLSRLGFDVPEDEAGTYAVGTAAAVTEFQRQRGLRDDGICGPQTWNAVVEAGWSLGQRLLYYRSRMLRGDDVAALQRTLGSLGFDAGRVDGIFGPQTHNALTDFQRNAGLTVDGICGPSTLETLARVSTKAEDEVVAGVRERERLRGTPPTLLGRRVVVGETGGLAALADATRRALIRTGAWVVTLHDPDESSQASQANGLQAEVYLGLRLDAEGCGCSSAYFRGRHGFESEGGRRLAGAVQAVMPGSVGVPDLGVQGMTLPVLRETRMPAVVVELGPAKVVVERSGEVAHALTAALRTWVGAPCND
jgi:N-acetylmuramoyl-L-alanine amidase